MRKILIIDPDVDSGLGLFNLLLPYDDHLIITDNLAKGFILATDSYFDIVIADFKLPSWYGYYLIGRFREIEFTKQLPLLLVSDRQDERVFSYALQIGANDYLIRPFSPEQVWDKVNILTNCYDG